MTGSRDQAYFDRLYAASDDPWNFRASPYEHAKYAATLEALEGRRYAAALEVGCSIGELTWRLADLCDTVLGVDIAAAPLALAAERARERPELHFQLMAVPGEFPAGPFDLIVLSEVLYFLSPDDIRDLAGHVRGALTGAGLVLLVNWRGPIDEPCQGEAAADLFLLAMAPAFISDLRQDQPGYRIERLRRAS